MVRLLLIAALAVGVSLSASVSAQITSTEIFLTHDWGLNNITTGQTLWDNCVMQDEYGTQYTITFAGSQVAQGLYGTIFADGPYRLEHFWITLTGLQVGHDHLVTTSFAAPVPFPPAEETHGNGANQHVGIRFFRADGRPFTLISIDYAAAKEPFYVGPAFTGHSAGPVPNPANANYYTMNGFTDFGTSEGLVLNSTTWNTMSFLPQDVAGVRLSQSPAPTVSFNPSAGQFSILGTISSYTFAGGFEVSTSATDAVVGAPVTIFGTYTGNDLIGLSDVVFTSVTTNIQAQATDQLTVVNALSVGYGAPDQFLLGGANGAMPMRVRHIGQFGLNTVTRAGSGSKVLDYLANGFAASALMTFRFEISAGAPILRSIEKDFSAPLPVRDSAFVTNGQGSVALSFVNFQAGAQVFNVFALNPSNTVVGAGPFFGIEFSPVAMMSLNAPFGFSPFHIFANSDGNFFWGAPSGSLPTGLVADVVMIEVPFGSPTVTYVSPTYRLTF